MKSIRIARVATILFLSANFLHANDPAEPGSVAQAGTGGTGDAADGKEAGDPVDAEGQFELARALLRGEGMKKNVRKSFALMKSAADQGHAEAIGGMGYFYSNGIAVPKDEVVAAEWFRKGADKGSAKARLNLGKYLLDGKAGSGDAAVDQEEGRALAKAAADSGLPEAGIYYGSLLYFGEKGIPKDTKGSVPYLENAAEGGITDALNMLGVIHELGQGVPVDRKRAEQLYRKGALAGNTKAQGNLGRILGPDTAGPDVRIEAVAWLALAHSQGEFVSEKSLVDSTVDMNDEDRAAVKAKVEELKGKIVVK